MLVAVRRGTWSRRASRTRRAVAQLGSASALGAEGRRFESCRPDHRMQRGRRKASPPICGRQLDTVRFRRAAVLGSLAPWRGIPAPARSAAEPATASPKLATAVPAGSRADQQVVHDAQPAGHIRANTPVTPTAPTATKNEATFCRLIALTTASCTRVPPSGHAPTQSWHCMHRWSLTVSLIGFARRRSRASDRRPTHVPQPVHSRGVARTRGNHGSLEPRPTTRAPSRCRQDTGTCTSRARPW